VRNAYLLLLAVLLVGVAWFLFGGDEVGPGSLPAGPDLLDGAPGDGPGLRAEGRPTADRVPARMETRDPAPPEEGPRGPSAASGRVVDARRMPVAGAIVELRLSTRVLGRATSDADGRYGIALPGADRPDRVRGALVAHTGDGRMGMATVWLSGDAGPEQIMPVLVVSAAYDLDVHVVREGQGVLGARVAVVRRESGTPVLLSLADGDEEGHILLRGLPAGTLELYATAPGHGRGKTVLRLPRGPDEEPARVELQGERVLGVYVYDAQTQRPVAGAQVLVGEPGTMPEPHGPGYLPPLPPAQTDRDGHAVVRRLGVAETIYVNVRAPGYAFAAWWNAKEQTAPSDQGEVRIGLTRARTVRFPIVEGDVPVPADGTVLEVETRGVQASLGEALSARVEGGEVVLSGLGPAAAIGTFLAPSGAHAPFTAASGHDRGATVTFLLPRTVKVRVIEAGGAPVAGLPLLLNTGGRSPRVAPVVTGEDGLAVFEGVGGERVSVHVQSSEQVFGGPALATLDLTQGIDVHEVVLQPGVELRLTLRIDGVARLPGVYALMVSRQRIDAALIREDPAAGELTCRVRPPLEDGALQVELHADGFLPETIEADAHRGAIERTLDLRPAGRLLVRVTPPADGDYSLFLERWEGASSSWVPFQIPTRGSGPIARGGEADADGTHAYAGLAPGRYRVKDRRTGQLSDTIELGSGGSAEIGFDLSGAQWIQGRVVGPPGTNFLQARVLVEGRDAATSLWSGVRPDAQGSFRVRSSGSAPLTLRVTHPFLAPAAEGGRITVATSAKEVELRLEAGPELSFRMAGYEDASTPPNGLWQAPLTVHLIPESGAGAQAVSVQPVAAAGTFRLGGFRPGVYTLWITFGREHAPYVRRGLQLGAASLDLGSLTPPSGSTLRIRVAGYETRTTAAVWVVVSHADEPAYARTSSLDRDTGEIVARGLGAGRFNVVVRGAGLAPGAAAAQVLLERVVEADGQGDVTLDLRLP